jgi:hypothetical protein
MVFGGARHCGRSLAGTDDEDAVRRVARQMRRQAKLRVGGGDCGIEKAAEETAWVVYHPCTVRQYAAPIKGRDLRAGR